ncbi:MAG: hypothetical protein QM493_03630 [Sulfurovum sp.]
MYKIIIVATVLVFGLTSCYNNNDNYYRGYSNGYNHINCSDYNFMTYEELDKSVEIQASKEIDEAGKIYLFGDILLINEKNKGVHIIDNSNKSSPNSVAFIQIFGNIDIAVKDGYLYADSFMDLVIFDIRDINNIIKISRKENVFPMDSYQTISSNDYSLYYDRSCGFDKDKGIIVEAKDSTSSTNSSTYANSSSTTTGKAGSMARFAIVGDNLYTINSTQMDIFDISDPSSPTSISKVRLPWDVETLFAYSSYLYIGSSSGMYIYDNSIPTQPTKITTFSHAQSCDPVVVQEDIAYVTLNSGSSCWNNSGINRLEIVDVKNPITPILIKQVDMWEPKGLSIDNNLLFICDGSAGLKVFDVNKTEEDGNISVALSSISNETTLDCYDVITSNNHLIVSNSEDIRQFDYSEFPMKELGRIK